MHGIRAAYIIIGGLGLQWPPAYIGRGNIQADKPVINTADRLAILCPARGAVERVLAGDDIR